MPRMISAVTLIVTDYDEAIAFYRDTMGFSLIEDTPLGGGKRWVLVAPESDAGSRLLLAKAEGEDQKAAIGNQTGGRVFLFLSTDDFTRDYEMMVADGVDFLEQPRHESYGSVAVFQDPFGNKWDLIEPKG